MSTATFVLLGSLLVSQSPPDEIDVFTSPGARPNVLLLVDNSSSLNGNPKPATRCPWFANTYLGGTGGSMKAVHQLQAALVGCERADDGLLGRYFSQINVAVGQMDAAFLMRAGWGQTIDRYKTELLALSPSGSVKMVPGIREAARAFNDHFDGSNSSSCAPFFIIYIGGGNDNGSGQVYDAECSGYQTNVSTGYGATGYLSSAGSGDMLCRVPGNQNIDSWVIGISPTGSGVTRLQNMALNGNGEYFLGNSYDEIVIALDSIFSNIVSRANVTFTSATVQTDGLFAQNSLYSGAFSPRPNGPWAGNVKKHCIFPRRLPDKSYDPSDRRCVFTWDSAQNALLTNPSAVDVWTGATSQEATIGGAGAMIGAAAGNNLGAGGGTPATPYWPRKILTWRAGTASYVDVRAGTWSDQDAWIVADERAKLLNRIHGYTYAKASNGNPVKVAEWPLGDPIHSNSALFRYHENCEGGPNRCWLVVATNHGTLEFLDAATGKESSALIPSEVWKPSDVARHPLSKIMTQPNAEWNHRYYFDGAVRRYHQDTNGDAVINNGEAAFLVVGLGRGGNATYLIPMGRFDGIPNTTNNPVRPILNTPGTPFEELRETWGGPWLGRMQHNGSLRRVAIFGSGHIYELDAATKPIPSRVSGPMSVTPISTPLTNLCSALFGLGNCSYYNLLGYADPMLDETYGPFSVPNAVAYRLVFDRFDIDPNDIFFVQDGLARRAAALTNVGGVHPSHMSWSVGLNGMVSPWVFDKSISWRFTTNGITTGHRGFSIARIEYLTATRPGQVEHYPTIYVTDLEKWNGSTPSDFSAAVNGDGVLVQISRSCRGVSTSRTCLDASQFDDLRHMTCPVSADVAVYTENERVSALYWGDECGQIFSARMRFSGATSTWDVRRILSLNNPAQRVDSQASPAGLSKDFRKIFRKLDLVLTTCSGNREIGVYFGSGNVQRPTAFDELQDPRLNTGRDVAGVVWDDGQIRNLFVERDLVNATSLGEVGKTQLRDPSRHGWYFELQPAERVLRDPIVVAGTAYFKTHHPINQATVCAAGSGQERIYAVDNCSARGVTDSDGSGTAGDSAADRQSWSAAGDIGGDPLLMVPVDDGVFVSHADLNAVQRAVVGSQRSGPIFRMLMWRVPKVR